MVIGREIKRSRGYRGTNAFRVRNWFIFASMSISILTGVGMMYIGRDKMNRLFERMEEEKQAEEEQRKRLQAIYERKAQALKEAGK